MMSKEDKITFDFLNKVEDEFVSMIEQLHRDIENLKKENQELEKEKNFIIQDLSERNKELNYLAFSSDIEIKMRNEYLERKLFEIESKIKTLEGK